MGGELAGQGERGWESAEGELQERSVFREVCVHRFVLLQGKLGESDVTKTRGVGGERERESASA